MNAGDTVTVTVTNVAVGDEIQITFAGQVIATATATADGNGQQALGALPPAGHLRAMSVVLGGAKISFRIPNDTATGTYEVRAIGPGFNANCAEGTNGLAVLGATVTTSGGGGSLSKTGIEVGIYLAVALALILAGWQLVRIARTRRRRVTRRHQHKRLVSR